MFQNIIMFNMLADFFLNYPTTTTILHPMHSPSLQGYHSFLFLQEKKATISAKEQSKKVGKLCHHFVEPTMHLTTGLRTLELVLQTATAS
jgi:hypothetical protein